ncbi:MAG: pyrophosphorylase [Anaerolineae bacterium]|nr:pyrophosphorylase [Anaerolineae bacterium]
MADRILSTAAAREAVKQLQSIITGPFLDQITALDKQGDILSNPNEWDGKLAEDFRTTWDDTHQKLVQTKEALEELRVNIQTIHDNIWTAGGNM